MMIIIGLTGGIATGKSTVARMLAAKGALLIDADEIAREVVEPGEPAWREIVAWLGESVLLADGAIDRERLGRLVFSDAAIRRKLNAIVHPRVGQEFAARTAEIRRRDPGAVLVYDIPLLIEAGLQHLVDWILLVYLPPEIQLRRLQLRDNLSREEALARVSSQMALDEKKNFADTVIDNSGTIRQTARQVERSWAQIHKTRPVRPE
jgi:dephospho-CoA kinase